MTFHLAQCPEVAALMPSQLIGDPDSLKLPYRFRLLKYQLTLPADLRLRFDFLKRLFLALLTLMLQALLVDEELIVHSLATVGCQTGSEVPMRGRFYLVAILQELISCCLCVIGVNTTILRAC